MRLTPKRTGYVTMVEMIVVMGVLGYLAVTLSVAVAQVREAAARTESQNNLKQIALAIHNVNDVHTKLPPTVGRFPTAAQQPNSPQQSIFFHILPYMEQGNVYASGTRKNADWRRILATRIKTYVSPQDPQPLPKNTFQDWLATTNYAANVQTFGFVPGGGERIPATFQDGTSNTIIFAERYQMCDRHPNAWAYNAVYYWAPMYGYYSKAKFQQKPKATDCNATLPQGLGSDYTNVALGDGSVHTVMNTISPRTWNLVNDPDDGNVLPADW